MERVKQELEQMKKDVEQQKTKLNDLQEQKQKLESEMVSPNFWRTVTSEVVMVMMISVIRIVIMLRVIATTEAMEKKKYEVHWKDCFAHYLVQTAFAKKGRLLHHILLTNG